MTKISAMLDRGFGQEVAKAEAAQAPAQPAPAQQGRLLGALSAMGVRVPDQQTAAAVAPTAAPKDDRRCGSLLRHRAAGQIDGWNMAVVLEVDRQAATIGLEDGSQGRITVADMNWARRLENGRVGRQVGGAADVAGQGRRDLGRAGRPRAPTAVPPIRLRQMPEVSGRAGRASTRTPARCWRSGRLRLFAQRVQPRHPGGAPARLGLQALRLSLGAGAGYTPTSLIDDAPISVDQGQGGTRYRPRNYGGGFLGLVTLRVRRRAVAQRHDGAPLVEMGLQRSRRRRSASASTRTCRCTRRWAWAPARPRR